MLKKENVLALSFLLSAPLFHTSALFADLVLMVALISPRRRRSFYLWAIIISFVICLTSVFKQAEQLLQSTVLYLDDDIEIMSRYENYSQDSFKYDSGFYLVLKSALPLNFMALLVLYMCKRDYDIFERLYFWLVIVANLFFYFSYMFRLQMYFYPMACIAIANMLWPTLQKRRFDMVQIIVILFIVLISYTSYVNLVKDDGFVYHFFF